MFPISYGSEGLKAQTSLILISQGSEGLKPQTILIQSRASNFDSDSNPEPQILLLIQSRASNSDSDSNPEPQTLILILI